MTLADLLWCLLHNIIMIARLQIHPLADLIRGTFSKGYAFIIFKIRILHQWLQLDLLSKNIGTYIWRSCPVTRMVFYREHML